MLIPQMAAAGLLAGDRIIQRIRVGAGGAMDLVSAGAMLTYGSATRQAAVSDWTLDLGPGSTTRILSEPYVVFDNAELVLRQTHCIAPDAVLVSVDGIVDASVQKTARWQTETIAHRPDGTVLFKDRQRADSASLSRQARLPGAWTAFGTLTVLTPDASAIGPVFEAARRQLDKRVWSGWSFLPAMSGASARIAAPDGQRLRAALHELLKIATNSLLTRRGAVRQT